VSPEGRGFENIKVKIIKFRSTHPTPAFSLSLLLVLLVVIQTSLLPIFLIEEQLSARLSRRQEEITTSQEAWAEGHRQVSYQDQPATQVPHTVGWRSQGQSQASTHL
jgi:hypothetical protein